MTEDWAEEADQVSQQWLLLNHQRFNFLDNSQQLDVQVSDLSLTDYIAVKQVAKYLRHFVQGAISLNVSARLVCVT